MPIGAFLVIHLLTNARILAPGLVPGEEFQKGVDQIHGLGPMLLPVEIVFIFLPLLFHSLVGFQIMRTGKNNPRYYHYNSNIRYSLQRWTGVIAFFFIMYHVWQMHWFGEPIGGGKFDPEHAALSAAKAIQSVWWIAPIYAIGVVASVFHLTNGIWTSLITWGVTIKPRSQRAAGYVCATFGVIVALIGLGALNGFKRFGADTVIPKSSHTMAGESDRNVG